MKRRSFFSHLAASTAGVVLASSIEVFGWITPYSDLPKGKTDDILDDHLNRTVEAFKEWWMHQGAPSGEEWDKKEAMLSDRLKELQIEKYGEDSIKTSIAHKHNLGRKIYNTPPDAGHWNEISRWRK